MVLGNRMKGYEQVTRQVLPPRTYTLIRVDIRAAHTLLKGAARPFDYTFMADMDIVAETLCKEISGAVLAFTQSDEISILLTDFRSSFTMPWFDGVTAKMISISAALATATLNRRRPDQLALFDSRVWTIPDPVEVANYFIWRQRDAVRNSISMAAQAQFPHQRLMGLNGNQMQELLFTVHGINWSNYPVGAKRGRVCVKKTFEGPVEYVHTRTGETVSTTALRSAWVSEPAPHFAVEAGNWLMDLLPRYPDLPPASAPATAVEETSHA
jgi:tRNA(His) 5'-end guanylyltransferase